MRKLVGKIALFLFLMYVIDKPIGYFISQGVQHKQVDNRIGLLAGKKLNKDLFVIGSSRAVNDIDPALLETQLKKSAYNLGYSGSNILFHATIFKLIMATHRPETLLLTLDGAMTFVPSDKGIYRKDKLAPYLSYYAVLNEYCAISSKHQMASKICWLYRENQNFFPALDYWKTGQDQPDETTAINEHGAIFLPANETHVEEVAPQDRILPYDQTEEERNRLERFEYIVHQATTNGIALYLVIPPNYQSKSPGFSERIKTLVNERCRILDFSDALQEKSLYFDNGHLNKEGAMKLTQLIAEQL
jgi:hypothetical protein